MGARRFEELAAWRLAAELRDRLDALATVRPLLLDSLLASQLRDAAASAPRNLAEGFGHFHPREFGRYVRIARASLLETRNHLRHATTLGYISADDSEDLLRLNARALAATTGLLRYLVSCGRRAPSGW
jgi:four helix bundle protein